MNLEAAIDTCTFSGMVDHRVEVPAGFWIVTAAIFAINAVLAARNGMGLMAFSP